MLDRIFRLFSVLKTKQKKTLLFSVFSMSFYIYFPAPQSGRNHHSGGVYRQISPAARVKFMSMRRWFLLPQ